MSTLRGPASNQRMNAPHSGFTALAHSGKRRAAGRARYAVRWTGSDQDFSESGFGRIFVGTK